MKWKIVVMLAVFICTVGCHKLKRTFDVQPVAENSMVKLSVQKILFKKGRLRVWATLENKTDNDLEASYGGFKLISNGVTVAAPLRVPFVRITKGFILKPRMIKRLPGPVEGLHVTPAASATLRLDGIRVRGQGGATSSISVSFPFQDQTP